MSSISSNADWAWLG